MPQKITLREAIEKTRKAIEEGRLAAVLRGRKLELAGDYGCCYVYPHEELKGVGCAIGVCMTPETIAKVAKDGLHGACLDTVVNHRLITADKKERPYLLALQFMHDSWLERLDVASAAFCGNIPEIEPWFEKHNGKPIDRRRFLSFLSALEKALPKIETAKAA